MTTDREIVSLREYFEERIRAHEDRDQERWRQHEQVHVREREQLQLASRIQDERLKHMNEFREQISKERTKYVTRSEAMWAFGTAIVLAGVIGGMITRIVITFL